MKRTLALFFLGFAPASVSGQDSVIRFLNEDRLQGRLEALDQEMVTWSSPLLAQPAQFRRDRVMDVTLPSTAVETGLEDHEAVVTLTSGDVFRGTLISFDEAAVELQTRYAGRLRFRRAMVGKVTIEEKPVLIFRGPDSLDGWQQSRADAWTSQAGAFVSKNAGAISREIPLPERCRVSFDVEWRGDLRIGFAVFAEDRISNRSQKGWEVSVQRRSISLHHSAKHQIIGQTTDAPELLRNEKVRIEVRVNRSTGDFCIYLDGRIVEVWQATELDEEDFGNSLRFASQGNSPVRISRIAVAEWDGTIEERPDPRRQADFGHGRFGEAAEEEIPADESRSGRLILKNGDSVEGQVVSIANGRMHLKTPYGEVHLPVSRFRDIEFGSTENEIPKRMKGDVRAWFGDGSSAVFRPEGIDGETLTAFSQTFGTAAFRIAAFSRIEFNIYDPELEKSRRREW